LASRRPHTVGLLSYVPFVWNCGCTTYQLAIEEPETPTEKIPYVNIPKMFAVNLAEHGLVFPKGSSYYVGCPKEILKESMNLLPYEHRFETIYQNDKGGSVNVYVEYIPNPNDHKLLFEIAHEKAKEGHVVHILLELNHIEDSEKRKLLIRDAIGNKNPDLKINGDLVEVKNLQ
jgi:hypothetical protein